MVRRQGIWAALAVLVIANPMWASVTAAPRAAFRHLYAFHQNGRVAIQNVYGNVSIVAWDRDAVLVEAIKHASTPGQMADAQIVVEPGADSLSIRTQYSGSDAEHPTSVEYRITVPHGVTLENVSVTNGKLSIDGLSGSVKASAVNGDIHAQKLGGQADLSTINGKVDADFNHTSRDNAIHLSSVNGLISLTIPSHSGAHVEAQNRSGGISSDLGHVAHTSAGHRLSVKGAGPQIHLHNINGGISIRSYDCSCT